MLQININSLKKIAATLTAIALILPLVPTEALAAATGITVSPTATTTAASTQVNFAVAVVKSGGATAGTYVSVTDGANGGSFYDSNGNCNNTAPDSDSQFDINNSKNICYSNSTSGTYTITAQLLDGIGGSAIGDPKTVTITVEGVTEATDPNTEIVVCHASANHNDPYIKNNPSESSKIVSGHGGHVGPIWFSGITVAWGDIIPAFTWYEKVGNGPTAGWESREYLGLNWTAEGRAIWNNKCQIPPNNADLVITKTVNNATPFEGNQVTYTLTVNNIGPVAATSVVVNDTLPAGLTYSSATIAPSTLVPLSWSIPSLASGASWTVDVVATVANDQGGLTIVNTATVANTVNDPVTTNNTASITVRPVDVTVLVPGCTDVDAANYNNLATTDNASCLFELTVNKVIVGNTQATPSQFSFVLNNSTTTAFNQAGTAVVLVPNGSHTVTEVLAAGFTTSYDNCAPVVIAGTKATCTITNTVQTTKPNACLVGENLLSNGSFEEPVITGDWGIFGVVSPWVISLSNGLEIWRNFMGGASDGVQNVELDGNSATKIAQSVTTIAGATYKLSFDFSPRKATTLANNVVVASVDGTTLLTATGDGMALGGNQWTNYTRNFIATTTNTVVAFEDMGIGAVSYGSLMDNAVLCFVSAPVPKTCSIVSDATTLVGGVASTPTWVHPNWTKELTSGTWIWDATVEATNGETATFTKTFVVDNTATLATLKVAADNRYTVTLNGNPLTCDGTPADNFSATDTCAAPVVVGLNTLTFVVTNDPYQTTDVQINPSGLIYELTIDGATCSPVPVNPPNPTADTYVIEGYVWHDDNRNIIWDGLYSESEEDVSEDPLAGWTITITNSSTTYSTTTTSNEYGYYSFEVPAGTWVITQTDQSGWVRTTASSHTVTVPLAPLPQVTSIFPWLFSIAEAAILDTYGDYDFGNDIEPTVSGGGGNGGGNGRSGGSRNRTLGLATPNALTASDQVTQIPGGAPDTGAGGTAPRSDSSQLVYALYLRRKE